MKQVQTSKLERIIDRTFLEGYNYRFKSDPTRPNFKSKVMDTIYPYFEHFDLTYLINPGPFDIEKTCQILYTGDKFFEDLKKKYPKSSIRALKHRNLSVLLPMLFIERIRLPFVYGLREQESELKEKYMPENWQDRGDDKKPFDHLKKILVWDLSISENEAAQPKHGLPEEVRVNFSLSALNHAAESCEHGREQDIDYSRHLAYSWYTLARTANGFGTINSLIEALSNGLISPKNIPKNLKGSYSILIRNLFYRKCIEAIECSPAFSKEQVRIIRNFSIEDLCSCCFNEAKENYEEFFRRWKKGERPSIGAEKSEEETKYQQRTYAINQVNLAKTYFYLAFHSIEKGRRADFLENSRGNFKGAIQKEWKEDAFEKYFENWRYYARLCKLAESNIALRHSLEAEEALLLLNLEYCKYQKLNGLRSEDES